MLFSKKLKNKATSYESLLILQNRDGNIFSISVKWQKIIDGGKNNKIQHTLNTSITLKSSVKACLCASNVRKFTIHCLLPSCPACGIENNYELWKTGSVNISLHSILMDAADVRTTDILSTCKKKDGTGTLQFAIEKVFKMEWNKKK